MNISARTIIKQYGTGYYRATFLFPKKIREAVWQLYQFVRLPDEIVDTQISGAKENLDQWYHEWRLEMFDNQTSSNVVVHEFIPLVKTYHIPPDYIESFFDAMRQDLSKKRYETFDDLREYMYGSATVIGYMMSHIIGFQPGALRHAQALAEAFQMTNFLRDIKEDYEMRGRIYLPREDMEMFGVTEHALSQGITDDAWHMFMKFEIARTRALYEEGILGIPLLARNGRRAVYAAALIYKEILDKIEARKYDVFSRRITVSPFYKTVLLLKAVWYRNQ